MGDTAARNHVREVPAVLRAWCFRGGLVVTRWILASSFRDFARMTGKINRWPDALRILVLLCAQ
jgi:hypothetical protein